MEDKQVADRLVSIWPSIVKIVRFWESLLKYKRPRCKSYPPVVAAVDDPLIVAKLHFFSFIASLMQPFLTKYQTDMPMMPYMCDDLMHLCRSLLELVKPEILEKCHTALELTKIDLCDVKSFLRKKDLHLGFCSRAGNPKLASQGCCFPRGYQ